MWMKVLFTFLSSSQLLAPKFNSVGIGIVLLLVLSPSVIAAPWINTQDIGLRSDIETLSNLGVIKVPITTYPLMWAGIIKDLDNVDIGEIPANYKAMYWRVKSAGKSAVRLKPKRILKLSVASSEQVFRNFGDSARNEFELTATSEDMNKHFAWNVQVNRVVDPLDGDTFHYDGSYLSVVLGNWVATVGKVERWWGASWDSANLLSNNARPPLTISLDRNYPEPIALPVLNWLGPVSFSGFIGQLDDDRVIDEPYLSGLSFSAKPLNRLEASLRVTNISGGTTNTFSNHSESKRLTGLDINWNLPFVESLPTNVYLSVTEEGQKSNFSSQLVGLSSSFSLFEQDWRVFVEATKTYGSGANSFDSTYEDGFYRTGYRYNQRAIGSTYDNDSKIATIGLIGNLTRYQQLQVKIQDIKVNQNDTPSSVDSGHSVSIESVDTKRLVIKWNYNASNKHQFDIGFDISDNLVDSLGRQTERARVSASWSYYL